MVQLHFWIFLGSFIPCINIFISLPTVEIVFLRTLFAFGILGAIMWLKRGSMLTDIHLDHRINLILAGVLTGAFWVFFVLSAKIGNASVALIGSSTQAIWVSFLAPLFLPGRKIRPQEVVVGFNALFGVYIIVSSDFLYNEGLLAAMVAAFFSALVTLISGRYASRYHHQVITFYQMGGACLGASCILAGKALSGLPIQLDPGISDLYWILFLAVVYSVVAYSQLIRVMSRVSAFQVSLTNNMGPIYGTLTALLVFGQREVMNVYFYTGAFIIVGSILASPIATKLFSERKPLRIPHRH